MKKKLTYFLLIVMFAFSGCGKETKEEPVAELANEPVSEESGEQEIRTPKETEDEPVAELTCEPVSEESDELEIRLSDERKLEIEECLSTGNFQNSPIILEEVTQYLDEKCIAYEGYYSIDKERIDMTLEDGTFLIFLRTQNSDGTPIGYELILKDEIFNVSNFQENYLNAYDVITHDYYYPNLSEKIWTKEEIRGLNWIDCTIARNQLFAKYGRSFEDPFLQAVFSVKSWYEPEYSAGEFDLMSQEFLTDVERENLTLITEYEKVMGFRKTSAKDAKKVRRFLSGSWLDLDGDGTKEQVIYQTHGVGEVTATEVYPQKVTLNINDAVVEHDGDNSYQEGFITTMDDVHYYIVVGDDGLSSDFVSTFYQYENGELKEVGKMSAHPAGLQVYADNVIAREEIYHFQCQPVAFRYELIGEMFVKQEEEYYDYRQNIATTQQEVPLYIAKDSTEIGVIVEKGEEIQVMGGDMKNWVLLKKVATGEEGWLRVESVDDCILPDGSVIYSGDLFYELYFYG